MCGAGGVGERRWDVGGVRLIKAAGLVPQYHTGERPNVPNLQGFGQYTRR